MAGTDLSAREIAAMLNEQAEALCATLLPAGIKAGGYWNIGSVDGERGNSLKVKLEGPNRGSWADYSRARGERGGSGDMLTLVALTVAPPLPDQQEMANAIRWAKGWLGIESMDPRSLERQRERAKAAQARADKERAALVDKSRRTAWALWHNAAPLHGSPAQKYLEGRGIDFAAIGRLPGAIRFRHDVHHYELGRKLPAMLICGLRNGDHVATHATYLERRADGSWGKIGPVEVTDPATGEVRTVRASKKIFGKDWNGAHFPLHKGASRKSLVEIEPGLPVAVSEGCEDGLTYAMTFPEARVVMAGTLGNFGQLVLPRQAGDLILLAQNDEPGSKAAISLEKQIAAQQRIAAEQGAQRIVRGFWPAEGFKDLNDELRGVRA